VLDLTNFNTIVACVCHLKIREKGEKRKNWKL